MDLQSFGTIIGILSGLVTLIGAVVGAYDRIQERTHDVHAPVLAGSYPPPISNVSGPSLQPGGAVPPPGHHWPATPPLGTAQPGQPTEGTPVPRPGYGSPAGQWSNAPRPVTPYPMPYQQPYPHYAPQPIPRTWRSRLAPPGSSHWFPYPIALIGAATYFILSGIYNAATSGPNASADPSSDPFVVFVLLIATITYIATVVYAARQAIRLRRWGWLVSILLIIAYGIAAFGIFGPTTRPQPKAPSAYPPYPPRRM